MLKTKDELGAVLGTEHTLVNRADKIPKSTVLTLLYFTVAQCCWKIGTIKKYSHPSVFWEGLYPFPYDLCKSHGCPLCLPMTRQMQALEIPMLWLINVS